LRKQDSGIEMIRIEPSEDLESVMLTLSGRLRAGDLSELKNIMESYSRPIVLNLTEVKIIDRAAIGFLAEFEFNNGRIKSCPSYIREWIRQELAGRS
jgi:ABC-type transporter Mla MlaB component